MVAPVGAVHETEAGGAGSPEAEATPPEVREMTPFGRAPRADC
jgi:hypothetical protein